MREFIRILITIMTIVYYDWYTINQDISLVATIIFLIFGSVGVSITVYFLINFITDLIQRK